MQSNTRHHYPHFIFVDGDKRLWNPILKKAYIRRPEERIRLELVEYLTEEAQFPPSRLAFEAPVNLPRDKSSSRTDLICYDKAFTPLLLVECKAPEIQLDEKAALQISRYNTQVGAPYLLITNGHQDFWFHQQGDQLKQLDEIPSPFVSSSKPNHSFPYWSQRAFAGNKSHPDSRHWILEACHYLYLDSDSEPVFLKFEGSSTDFYLANYYRIFPMNDTDQLAIALTATPFGATKCNVILNQKGENKALMSISLDLLSDFETHNTIVQSAKGTHPLDLHDAADFDFEENLEGLLPRLHKLLLESA